MTRPPTQTQTVGYSNFGSAQSKVELFEQIRSEYEFGVGTITGVAKKLSLHRRIGGG